MGCCVSCCASFSQCYSNRIISWDNIKNSPSSLLTFTAFSQTDRKRRSFSMKKFSEKRIFIFGVVGQIYFTGRLFFCQSIWLCLSASLQQKRWKWNDVLNGLSRKKRCENYKKIGNRMESSRWRNFWEIEEGEIFYRFFTWFTFDTFHSDNSMKIIVNQSNILNVIWYDDDDESW